MNENKNEINDKELDNINGGIKIVTTRKTKLTDFIEDLANKIKDKLKNN